MGQFMDEQFEQFDALLLGRKTYQIFAAHWPRISDPSEPVAAKLNSVNKYVASSTLETADWSNSTVLRGDIAAEVARLKDRQARVRRWDQPERAQAVTDQGVDDRSPRPSLRVRGQSRLRLIRSRPVTRLRSGRRAAAFAGKAAAPVPGPTPWLEGASTGRAPRD